MRLDFSTDLEILVSTKGRLDFLTELGIARCLWEASGLAGGREGVATQVVAGHEETLEARPERLLLGHAGDAGHALAVGDLDGRVVGHSGGWFVWYPRVAGNVFISHGDPGANDKHFLKFLKKIMMFKVVRKSFSKV